MKLSEAIGLGSMIVKAKPQSFSTGSGESETACALGMAWKAIGGGLVPVLTGDAPRTGGDAIAQTWPFLQKIERRPCTCWFMRRQMQTKDIIAHLFDRHVFGKADWTMDRLQAWVESVEPKTLELTEPPLVWRSVGSL